MKINVNDKVLISSDNEVIREYNGEVATVKRIYSDVVPPIAYVEIEADLVARTVGLKVPIADLVLVPDEPKSEIPEGAREISKDDFFEALTVVTMPENHPAGVIKRNPMASLYGAMTGLIIGREIGSMIFGDQDVVTLTRDQLIVKLWDGCNPENVSEFMKSKVTLEKAVDFGCAAMMLLQNIPAYLFDESEND